MRKCDSLKEEKKTFIDFVLFHGLVINFCSERSDNQARKVLFTTGGLIVPLSLKRDLNGFYCGSKEILDIIAK